MKTLAIAASILVLSPGLVVAFGQGLPVVKTTSPDHDKAAIRKQTANRRAATYQGPKVVSNSKELGEKMVQKSKPTDMRMRLPVPALVK